LIEHVNEWLTNERSADVSCHGAMVLVLPSS